jgi:hypothetical protein
MPIPDSTAIPSALGYVRGGHNQADACEVFADAVVTKRSSHGLLFVKLFIKTLNEKLDGNIVEVGMYAHRKPSAKPIPGEPLPPLVDGDYEWRSYKAERFVGSGNYFDVELPIAHDWMANREYEGSIYVKTDQGTYYWSSPQGPYSNYVINADLAANVDSRLPSWANHYSGLREYALSTAESTFDYGPNKSESLNRKNCR